MSEEAGDVFGAQGVVEDGATDRLLQHTQQDQLLIDLRRERRRGEGEEEEEDVPGSSDKRSVRMMMMMMTHLDDGLGDEGVEVRHQFAVDVSHVEVLRNDGDEAHRPVTDPQVGVTQERSYGKPERTNDTIQFSESTHSRHMSESKY